MSAVITKMIKNGGFSLNVYQNLFESCVCSVTDYGGEIWGYKEYESIKKVQLKGARAFLGLPKQTSIPGILAELNWLEPRSRTQLQMIRHFHRMLKLDDNRLTKKIFLWDKHLNDTGRVSTWSSEVKDILYRNNMDNLYDQLTFPKKDVVSDLKKSLIEKDQRKWQSKCQTLPKLRTFMKFKDFSKESPHIYKPLSFKQRKEMSKLRLGLLNLRIETARSIRPSVPPEQRLCLLCNNGDIEDETHFLLSCGIYDQARQILFDHIPEITPVYESCVL